MKLVVEAVMERMQGLRARGGTVEMTDEEEQIPLATSPEFHKRTKASHTTSGVCSRPRTTARHLYLKWSLLSCYSRAVLVIVLPLLVLHICLGTMDLCFHYYGNDPNSATVPKQATENSFAVVINTYKRPQRLQQAVQHYADTCGKRIGIDQVFVVWAELDVTPPEPSTFFRTHTSALRTKLKQQNRASVEIVRVAKDSLNSRFLPLQNLSSTAVFMVDDDLLINCASLQLGFDAYKTHSDSMVGYYPRLAAPGTNGELVYYSWPTVFWRHQVNFVLTKACFLHARYLSMYSYPNQHPSEILDYVDAHKNCEDVAMSMLVANVTRSENNNHIPEMPIYVEGHVRDSGLFGGISTGSGHMQQRSQCLNDLSRIYENHGWSAPLEHVFELSDASWVHHVPNWRWQYRPSNVFEWFALGNVFK